jgi:hypothetical protein
LDELELDRAALIFLLNGFCKEYLPDVKAYFAALKPGPKFEL